MATLAQIRTRVLAKLADSGGSIAEPTAAQVDAQINSTIDFYENGHFWFNEAVDTGLTTVGDPLLTLPADFGSFISPNEVVIEQANVKYPLQKITPLAYDSIFVGGTGMPRYFTYRNGLLELYFPPNQAYTYYINYLKNYPDLVDDAEENDFTVYADRLIEYKTLADCYLDYRSDAEMAAVYQGIDGAGGRVKIELNSINTTSYKRLATGNLTTENVTGRSRSTIFER